MRTRTVRPFTEKELSIIKDFKKNSNLRMADLAKSYGISHNTAGTIISRYLKSLQTKKHNTV